MRTRDKYEFGSIGGGDGKRRRNPDETSEVDPARDRFADTRFGRNQSSTRDVPVARPNRRQGRGEITLYGQRYANDLSGAHATARRVRAKRTETRDCSVPRSLVKQVQGRTEILGAREKILDPRSRIENICHILYRYLVIKL